MFTSTYTIRDESLEQGLPIEVMAKAFAMLDKQRPGLTLDQLEPMVCLYRSPRKDPVVVEVQNADTGERTVAKFDKIGVAWIPARSIAYINAQSKKPWTMVVAANGSAEVSPGINLAACVDAVIPADATPLQANALRWLKEGPGGSSARQMCLTLAGVGADDDFGPHHPHDPSDLGRCLKFLDAVPEARAELGKMRALSPAWSALVDRWDDLERSYRAEQADKTLTRDTYGMMRAILDPIENRRRPQP